MNENTPQDIFEQRLKMFKTLSQKVSLNTKSAVCRLMRPIWKRGKSTTESMIAERLAKEINDLLNDTISEETLIQKATEKQKEILKEEGIL